MIAFTFSSEIKPEARWGYVLLGLVAGTTLGILFLLTQWSWLAPLPLAVVFWSIDQARDSKSAFWTGFGAGIGFFAVLLAWLPQSFANLFGWVGAVPMPFLVLALAGFWGATAAVTRLLAQRYTLLALAGSFVLLEWLRSLGPLAFVWGTLGYALGPTPVVQVAELGGVHLLSLLVTLSASGLTLLLKRRPFTLMVASSLLGLSAIYGLTRPIPAAPNLEVLLVQGSVSPLQKARGRSQSELELYERLTLEALRRGAKPDLIVFPEGALPNPPDVSDTKAVLEKIARPMIFGAAPYIGGQRFNSAFAWDGTLVSGRFDKIKLVPFGEFFPFQNELQFVYQPIFRGMGLEGLRGTAPGTQSKPLELGKIKAGTYICYESTFPGISRRMVLNGANLLVNISNDAWFGTTVGAEQHFQMGRVRAIETGRWIARAGNDGITAVIDPLGNVSQRFARLEVRAFSTRVGLSDVITPFVRFGDWVIAAVMLGLLVIVYKSNFTLE